MATYNKGGLLGVVGYDEVYSSFWGKPRFESLLKGLSRIWTVRLVSNMQNKLVGMPFYNPYLDGVTNTQLDAPRFFLGPQNQAELQKVIRGYEKYLAEKASKDQPPMLYAADSETPLYLLRAIMAMPESENSHDIATLERNLFKAYLLANDASISRDQGKNPYKPEVDKELYLSTMLMSRFAYNDITSIKSELRVQLINQTIRCITLFDFITQNDVLKDVYFDFLADYRIVSWEKYLCTYWSVFAMGGYRTGIIDFDKVRDEDHLIEEYIFEKDSIDIHSVIPLEDNVDYVAFRNKPFIKIGPRQYAVVDIGFVIDKIYNSLYFTLNSLWQSRNPDKPKEFNRIFTTEYSEEYMLAGTMKEVSDKFGWFSLTDAECKSIVSEKRLSSPPDFYIRNGNEIVLFEGKDVKIRKEIKADGTIKELINEAEKSFVGYTDERGKYNLKGVGQLVRNAKRIQEEKFLWDPEADKNSTIYLVLVVADPRQVAAGWKNYLNRRMYDECNRQGLDVSKVRPLVLTDLGTLYIYKKNFLKKGLFYYLNRYLNETAFDEKNLNSGHFLLNVMNQTMSFSKFMCGEKCLADKELHQRFLKAIRPSVMMAGDSIVTKTLAYEDFYDDQHQSPEQYLKGIDKQWLLDGVIHFISIDSYKSFSMRADNYLMMIFQDYLKDKEVERLFNRLYSKEREYPGTYPTLINHQALYRLLSKIILMPDREGKGECIESYQALLKAILAENSIELENERSKLAKIVLETELRDALVIMQQDLQNVNMFGTNINELVKTQILKFLALCGFGKNQNKKVGDTINSIIERSGFKNVYSYLITAQMPLKVYHDKENFSEGVTVLKKEDFEALHALDIWDNFVKYITDKHLDLSNRPLLESRLADSEIKDNTCYKIGPVLKTGNDRYEIISRFYYALLIYDGFWWQLRNEMVPTISFKEFRNILSKDFFEKYLFCETVRLIVKKKKIKVVDDTVYPPNQPCADMMIRTKKDIYFFEFKDMRVSSDVADGNDIDALIEYLDDRLNHSKNGPGDSNSGLPQLVSNMEDYFKGKVPGEMDYDKGKVKLHPILVVNSRLFTVRGLNYIMQYKLAKHIQESAVLSEHEDEIGELLVLDYDMLLLTVVWCYHDSAEFHRLFYMYMHSVENASTPDARYNSFRSFAMTLFEKEMKDPMKKKKFQKGFKRVVKKLLKDRLKVET